MPLTWTPDDLDPTYPAVEQDGSLVLAAAEVFDFRGDVTVVDEGGGVVSISVVGGAAGPSDCGTATILDTESTVAVPHALGFVPLSITVTPRASEPDLWVPARDDTEFVIERSGTTGDLQVDWKACGEQPLSLDDLDDVTITDPQDGDELVFDGAEWENG